MLATFVPVEIDVAFEQLANAQLAIDVTVFGTVIPLAIFEQS